jgi:hypothetical protein
MDDQKELSKFDILVRQNELPKIVAEQLRTTLSTCDIILLCDDSSSMNSEVSEGSNAFATNKPTRWDELNKLAATVIKFATAINPNGIDLYFLNRDKKLNVSDLNGLQEIFSEKPNGNTNITKTLKEIYGDKRETITKDRQLLVVVITDGQPTDGTSNARTNLFNYLNRMTRSGNVHISFAECTDDESIMEYLDGWDQQIINFDNTDDYPEEARKVKLVKGRNFKFDYTDYVIKILLATFLRQYFNLDQVNRNNQYTNDDCCNIL